VGEPSEAIVAHREKCGGQRVGPHLVWSVDGTRVDGEGLKLDVARQRRGARSRRAPHDALPGCWLAPYRP